jgi:hypothetical protein
MGGGFDDVTPHGKILGDLQRVAEAQAAHHAETGTFAAWTRSLELASNPDVRVTILRGGATQWEAVAYHPVGLSCAQVGRLVRGAVRTDPAVCFTTEP